MPIRVFAARAAIERMRPSVPVISRTLLADVTVPNENGPMPERLNDVLPESVTDPASETAAVKLIVPGALPMLAVNAVSPEISPSK